MIIIVIDDALFIYLKRSKFDRISQFELLGNYNSIFFKMYPKKVLKFTLIETTPSSFWYS